MKRLLLSIGLILAAGVNSSCEARNYEPMFKDGEKLTATKMNELGYKLQELQRQVEGMQKQITVLHGKKVDVDVAIGAVNNLSKRVDAHYASTQESLSFRDEQIKKTREQTAHITRMLDTKIDKLSDRVKELETPTVKLELDKSGSDITIQSPRWGCCTNTWLPPSGTAITPTPNYGDVIEVLPVQY